MVVLAASPARAEPNFFTVNSLDDASDADTGDDLCWTEAGECTLRAAIEQANATANVDGPDEIGFGVAGQIKS